VVNIETTWLEGESEADNALVSCIVATAEFVKGLENLRIGAVVCSNEVLLCGIEITLRTCDSVIAGFLWLYVNSNFFKKNSVSN
jgi:hypothetical protein